MWYSFVLQNVHFALYIFGALVCFAMCWLYVDAWKQSHTIRDFVRIIGLSLISISYIFSALFVETVIASGTIFGLFQVPFIATVVRSVGALCVVLSLWAEPLVDRPGAKVFVFGTFLKGYTGVGVVASSIVAGITPVLFSFIALLYLRRSTVGLERHVRPVAWAFATLAISEFISLRALFEITTNISLYEWVAPFGVLWILQHGIYFIGIIMLSRWVKGYVFKQFDTQLLMIFMLTILFIFLVTTVSFTGLLLVNMQNDALQQMTTDVKVLQFSLDSQKSQLLSEAQLSAKHDGLIQAMESKDRAKGSIVATDMLLAKKTTSLVVVSDGGTVFARGEDAERIGESLSSESLVKRVLLGESLTSVSSLSGVLAPILMLRAGVPIRNAHGSIIGAVILGTAIDTAFVDGLKAATNLDVSVYGGDTISATSFVREYTSERAIGRKELSQDVKKRVLSDAQVYAGPVVIQNDAYIGAYAPLIDVDKNAIGMVFVGRPESAVLDAAGRSIQYTFVITVFLLLCSIVPAFRIARYLVMQL